MNTNIAQVFCSVFWRLILVQIQHNQEIDAGTTPSKGAFLDQN